MASKFRGTHLMILFVIIAIFNFNVTEGRSMNHPNDETAEIIPSIDDVNFFNECWFNETMNLMCCVTKIGEEIYHKCDEIKDANFANLTTSEEPMTSTVFDDSTTTTLFVEALEEEENFDVETFEVIDAEESSTMIF